MADESKLKAQARELKPCPFCGGEPTTHSCCSEHIGIRCDACKLALSTPVGGEPRAKTISRWNARQVADGQVKAETADLRDELQSAIDSANAYNIQAAKDRATANDLRDRLARYEAMIGQAYRIEFTDWERVIEKSGSYTSKTGIVWRIEDEDGNKFSLHETALEAFEKLQEVK